MNHTQNFATAYVKQNIFGFMYNDLEHAINLGKTYFLTALGLSAYTEFMGGLVTGHLKDEGWSKKNYRAFLPYLGQHYVNLDNKINLYKRVRCGLVHEYFVKGPSMISLKTKDPTIRGIVYTPTLDHITFYLRSYFQDFKDAVQNYYDILMAGDAEALQKFRNAVME